MPLLPWLRQSLHPLVAIEQHTSKGIKTANEMKGTKAYILRRYMCTWKTTMLLQTTFGFTTTDNFSSSRQ